MGKKSHKEKVTRMTTSMKAKFNKQNGQNMNINTLNIDNDIVLNRPRNPYSILSNDYKNARLSKFYLSVTLIDRPILKYQN